MGEMRFAMSWTERSLLLTATRSALVRASAMWFSRRMVVVLVSRWGRTSSRMRDPSWLREYRWINLSCSMGVRRDESRGGCAGGTRFSDWTEWVRESYELGQRELEVKTELNRFKRDDYRSRNCPEISSRTESVWKTCAAKK